MKRTEYQRLETLLTKAMKSAINDKEYRIASVLRDALNTIVENYIYPDDLSTL